MGVVGLWGLSFTVWRILFFPEESNGWGGSGEGLVRYCSGILTLVFICFFPLTFRFYISCSMTRTDSVSSHILLLPPVGG